MLTLHERERTYNSVRRHNPQHSTDIGALIAEFVSTRKPSLYNEIVRLSRGWMVSHARSILHEESLAEDAAQDACLRLLGLTSYAHRGQGRAFLRSLVDHSAHNLRARSWSHESLDEALDAGRPKAERWEASGSLDPEQAAQASEMLATLPEAQRPTLVLMGSGWVRAEDMPAEVVVSEPKRLSPGQRSVLEVVIDAVRAGVEATAEYVAEKLGKTAAGIRRFFTDLRRGGWLSSTGAVIACPDGAPLPVAPPPAPPAPAPVVPTPTIDPPAPVRPVQLVLAFARALVSRATSAVLSAVTPRRLRPGPS